MSLNSIQEIIHDLRQGRMVVVMDDEDRENEGDLIIAADLITAESINFMAKFGRGLICLTLTKERCRQLRLPLMVNVSDQLESTNFTVSIEAAEGVTTGISAADRATTVRAAVAPDARPEDLVQPGHIFPLMAQPGGVLNRAGHTEAASDLALLAGFEPAGVLVEILNPDGTMARRPELEAFARAHGLKIGSIEDLIRHRLETEHTVERIDSRPIGTDHGPFVLHTYRDRLTRGLHFALARGEWTDADPVLVRVQAQNPLADALHWRRDDFGPLVGDVLALIAAEGRGVLVLLGDAPDAEATLARIREQPAPPASKAGALAQWRRNGAGSQILADLGARHLRVLGTPRRQVGLAGYGLEVVDYVALPAR